MATHKVEWDVPGMVQELCGHIRNSRNDAIFEEMTGESPLAKEFSHLVVAQRVICSQLISNPMPHCKDIQQKVAAAEAVTLAAMFNVFLGRHPEIVATLHERNEKISADVLNNLMQ